MSDKQRTIEKEISLEGVGLHTGRIVKLTFKPAKINTGIRFVRTDLEGKPEIDALATFVKNTQRGTNLEKNGVTINTSEHVLAAITGLDIDNIIIEVNSPEPPSWMVLQNILLKVLKKQVL
jgi:UDP-3-O-[3-hydroxymyristoyl] N-acetylglucosamine deacetylase/3-hydroxyacyl-[acyl-carrier-protein] dehydratase